VILPAERIGTAARIDTGVPKRFVKIAETELVSLNEGNFTRHQVRPREFKTWHKTWDAT
jgi:hypothetical protein